MAVEGARNVGARHCRDPGYKVAPHLHTPAIEALNFADNALKITPAKKVDWAFAVQATVSPVEPNFDALGQVYATQLLDDVVNVNQPVASFVRGT